MDIEPIFNALQMRNWYALAALALTLVIQIIRKNPDLPILARLKTLWSKTPNGLRWLWPATGGSATAFVAAFQAGVDLRGALMAAIGGALSIGIGAMGLNALFTELPLPWNGGSGGKPRDPKDPPTGNSPLKGSEVLRGLSTLGLCMLLLSCTRGMPAPPLEAPTSTLPPGDPCEREGVKAFGRQCGANCKAKGGDIEACLAECNKQIDERCSK